MMMIYINLIGLNSLIALLGDSYGKVQSNFDMYDIVLRLGLLIDLHQSYYFGRLNKDMKFIHFIQYEDHSSSSAAEWEGQIKRIEKRIDTSKHSL